MRRRGALPALALGLCFAVSAQALGQNTAAGREIAESVCADCHDVSANGQMKQDPPAFAAIAVYRTREKILEKIVAPHISMPRLVDLLEREEVQDVVDYIVSLDVAEE